MLLSAFACNGDSCAAGLAYEAYGAEAPGSKSILAVFIHGSVSAGGPADYMYPYAKRFSERHKNVIAVALLCPGYYDSKGKTSDGSDQARRIADFSGPISAAIQALRVKFGARKVIALGHSNGAMNLGYLIGRDPALLQGVVLVSGVYDNAAMSAFRNKPQFGLSGQDYLSGVARSTRIIAVHGTTDTTVPYSQSVNFIDAAKKRGLSADLISLTGTGHNFNGGLSSTAMGAFDQLAQ
jgi:predicted esterase